MKNQTLWSKNCLVSCEGIYAYITDESLQQIVMKGKFHFCPLLIYSKHTGFLSLTQDLDEDSRRRRLDDLEEIFSTSLDKNNERLISLTEEYNQYKRNYVEHIQFDPAVKNLSESCKFTKQLKILFSFHQRA